MNERDSWMATLVTSCWNTIIHWLSQLAALSEAACREAR